MNPFLRFALLFGSTIAIPVLSVFLFSRNFALYLDAWPLLQLALICSAISFATPHIAVKHADGQNKIMSRETIIIVGLFVVPVFWMVGPPIDGTKTGMPSEVAGSVGFLVWAAHAAINLRHRSNEIERVGAPETIRPGK